MEVEFQQVEKTERITIIPCHIWFNNAEHEVILNLPVTYWQAGYWSEIACEVELPDSIIVECADDFMLDVKISVEWTLRKTLVEPISFIE